MSSRAVVATCLLAAAGIGTIGAWTACSTFNAADPGVTEAGADADVGPDAAPADGSGPAADADGGPPGCARYVDASFCNDFDQPDPFSANRWTLPQTDLDSGTVRLTQASFVSPPSAAAFVMFDTATGCAFVPLSRRFSGAQRSMRVRASMQLDNAGFFLNVSTPQGAGRTYDFVLVMGPASIDAVLQRNETGGPFNEAVATIPFDTTPFGRFQDVMLEIDLPSRVATLTVGTVSQGFTLPPQLVLSDPTLTLGSFCHSGAQTVLADDVAVWVTPL